MEADESIVCPDRAVNLLGQGLLLFKGLCNNPCLYALSPCLVTFLWDETISLWTPTQFCLLFAPAISLTPLLF